MVVRAFLIHEGRTFTSGLLQGRLEDASDLLPPFRCHGEFAPFGDQAPRSLYFKRRMKLPTVEASPYVSANL